MQIKDALAGTDIAKSDAEVLLCSILGQNRAWLLAHHTDELTPEQISKWNAFADQKRKGEPTAYILHEREFYARKFYVDQRVLIPRGCTEKLIEHVKLFLEKPKKKIEEIDPDIVAWTQVFDAKKKPEAIVDVGTGSGCLAVTLALEYPAMKIYALDVSAEALEVAKANAETHGVRDRITFIVSDLLSALPDDVPPYLVVSNPPYLAQDADAVEKEVRTWEPSLALFSDDGGSALTKRLVNEAHADQQCVGIILETQKVFAK